MKNKNRREKGEGEGCPRDCGREEAEDSVVAEGETGEEEGLITAGL